jgi:DNA polymerase-3 subunit gamma/tau
VSSGPSLYRRHRPRTFSDVVGQEHVVRTLRNAVEQDKVHHAYLFVGSRGTGKTSMAKILASCMNCENGPTVEPCGVCPSCVAIASATSLDVIEMDAASNNSVDDIRELRDKVGFAPVSGRSKVYILDEAHMLSTAAWNAFLKTLEEPPPNTIFVLATTEADKVLATVVDRCHRFDFGRPTTEQLAGVVNRVAVEEGITIPPEAVALLARHATGSFRDALGTLEQLLTYSGTTITLPDALAVLGVADDDVLFGVVDAVAASDARAVLLAVHDLAQSGRDLGLFARHIESHARELMVTQTLRAVPAEIAVTPDRDARLADQAERVAPGDVVRLLDLLAVALRATKDGADARTQLELALVKAATPEVDPTTRALLARLERLEQAPPKPPIARPAPAPVPVQAAPAPPAVAPPPADPTPEPPAAPPPAPEAAVPPPVEAAPPAPAPAPAPPAPSPAPPVASVPEPPPSEWDPEEWVPGPEPDFEDAAPAPVVSAVPPPVASIGDTVVVATPPAAPPAPADAPQAAPPEPPAAVAPLGELDLEALRALWPAVVDTVAAEHALLAAVIVDARPVAFEDGELVVAFAASSPFNKRRADDSANREVVLETLRTLAGRPLRLRYDTYDDADPQNAAPAVPPPNEDEIVDRVKQAFDASEIIPQEEPEA